MTKPLALGTALLISTFLSSPGWAQTAGGAVSSGTAQSTGGSASAGSTPSAAGPASTANEPGVSSQQAEASAPGPDTSADAAVEISAPGAAQSDEDIVVVGRNIPNVVRSTPAVVSVLSAADISRTGEGDIAGALTRITGLSVVGEGFVYVRGLGDRYSLSLLNGSPLPSPEPLKRVVPLDIFPSRIVASAVVQKSYSPNYPGEFGGGVVNLTTTAIPKEGFFSLGVSGGVDTETTAKLGYTYAGGNLDFLGYDDGTRRVRQSVRNAGRRGVDITDPIAISNLSNADTTLLQRNSDIPMNFSADFSSGASFDLSDGRFGVVTSAGYSSTWQTRATLQQSTTDSAGALQNQFNTVLTDNRALVNGLIGFGAEIGDHKFRLTNIYIHDTVKQARLARGFDIVNLPTAEEGRPVIEQNTFFFERQLYDLQGVSELRFGDLSVDLRGTYAKTSRESPYERFFSYVYDSRYNDFLNRLNNSDQTATIGFSDLREQLWSGSGDVSYKLPTARPITLTAGYAYSDTDRVSTRYLFAYRGPGGNVLPDAAAQMRPDYLLSDYSIQTYGITLDNQQTLAASRYDAGLKIHGGYAMAEGEVLDGVRLSGGVRYEKADQTITAGAFSRTLDNDYWLPALTATWNFADNMQLRLHGSKTIARPQFRELAPQLYQDYTSDRQYTGNPFLTDSTLKNAEARYEWYFARDQRVSLAGFYKKLKNPIETVGFYDASGVLNTGFVNAPSAELYGGEVEMQKYVPLDTLGGDFFATRRLVVIANYTYSKSKISAGDEQIVSPIVGNSGAGTSASFFPNLARAGDLLQDGRPLTGQSDHLVNLQLGVEDTARLSQATLLFTYASNRVTNRGPVSGGGGIRQPDLVEKPGIRLDFVLREDLDFLGVPIELKFEARNLTGTGYREFQKFEDNTIFINRYKLGRTFSLGATMKL